MAYGGRKPASLSMDRTATLGVSLTADVAGSKLRDAFSRLKS